MTITKRPGIYLLLVVLLLTSLACGVSALNSESITEADVVSEVVPLLAPTSEPVQVAVEGEDEPIISAPRAMRSVDLEGALIDLYQQVNPSVVHILVYANRDDSAPLGSGSGFVYDASGRIVTNNHVVEDGALFEVVFADGSHRRAEVIGRDVDSDLAVIQVDSLPSEVSPMILGNSDLLQVGQLVIAIGNPFGEQGSMSLGIVSGLGRSLESQRRLDNSSGRYSLPQVIQTDAPINPGNSGGPLINLVGEVVGVNSAIRSTTGVNSGVGFSIPVNAVRRIVPTLIESGEYVYSYMGVSIQSLNLNLRDRFELPQVLGAYVTGVTLDGPAEDAGLIPARETDGQGGDLIVAIDGQPVQDTEQLISYLVFNTVVGQTVELTVIRGDETITLPLTLGARP